MTAIVADGAALHGAANARLVARLERLPVTPRLMLIRAIVGIATFFDGFTVLAIAFAMPSLVSEEAYCDRGWLDPLGRLCRSVVRRRDLWVAG